MEFVRKRNWLSIIFSILKEGMMNLQAARDFTIGMSITTLDPVNIELAKTYIYMSWNRDMSNIGTTVIPWSANPSPLGTHWYLENYYTEYPGGYSRSCSAFYYNDDFLNNNLRTNVKHWMKITPNEYGFLICQGNQKATGEAAYLLKFTLQPNIN